MSGKKRTRQQRQGESAEQAFTQFANDNGLLPGKPPDYGFDYLCQVEDSPDHRGTAELLGDVVAVLVRSSETRRPKLRLSRNDAQRILDSKVPVLLVMPHRPASARHWTIRSKAIDQPTFLRLADFLATDAKSHPFTPSELASERDFRNEVQRCLSPLLIERLAADLAEHRLKRLLPSPEVSIITRSAGSLSLIETRDYLAQFNIETEHDWLAFHKRGLAKPDDIGFIASSFGLKPSVLDAVRSLPQPVLVGGPCPVTQSGPCALYAKHPKDGRARCEFVAKQLGKYTSYVHASGFAIRVSEAMPRGGEHVHIIEAEIGSPIDLRRHGDLLDFLCKCIPPAVWHWRKEGGGISVEQSGNLPWFAIYAYELRRFDPQTAEEPLWELASTPTQEDCFMMTLVSHARNGAFPLGFTFGEHVSEEESHFWVPVVGNIGGRTLVAWLACEGVRFRDAEGSGIGVQVESVEQVLLDWNDGAVVKGPDPEVVVQPGWPTISIGIDGLPTIRADGIPELERIGIRFVADDDEG